MIKYNLIKANMRRTKPSYVVLHIKEMYLELVQYHYKVLDVILLPILKIVLVKFNSLKMKSIFRFIVKNIPTSI